MTGMGWFQIFLFFGVVLALTKPMGVFMARVFEREPTFLDFLLSISSRRSPRTLDLSRG